MNITVKKLVATLLSLMMVFLMMPAFAATYPSNEIQTEAELVEILRIINESGPSLLVGKTLQLSIPEGYTDAVWSSSNAKVATVDDTGLVTAIAAGKTTIKVKSAGSESTTNIEVVAPVAKETKQEGKNSGNTEDTKEPMTILVNGSKVKVQYDGKPHTISYTYSSDNDNFDESKVRLVGESPARTAAGAIKANLGPNDFAYEDSKDYDVTFIVNNGSIWITPVNVTVKADDQTIKVNKLDTLKLTATVSGLIEGDTLDYAIEWPEEEKAGTYKIEVFGEEQQGGYKVQYESGTLTVTDLQEQPLYNIVKIGGNYYRLAKTTIKTDIVIKDNYGKTLAKEDYVVEPYDFTNLTITVDGKEYVYNCKANADAIVDGANYYDVKDNVKVSVVKNKIGAMNGNTPRWIVPENQRYNDPNGTDSIHRDYEFVLHVNTTKTIEQTIYNFLSVDGSTDYYKLPATTIKAQPLENLNKGLVKEGEYILTKYDFSNTVLNIGGIEYKYNDGSLDQYENYFTVEFEDVEKNDKFNRNDTWFKKTESWLDGAYEQYGNLPNNTVTFHANYKAVTHKAEERARSVTIASDWPKGKVAFVGAKITLTATLEGFGGEYTLQWQYSADKEHWNDVDGANGLTYTYTLDETTAAYYWRIVADDKK